MNIIISKSNDQPIYNQIKEQIKEQILNGELVENVALPSIRKLAKDLQISVITTKRAYDELENEGFIETFPGKGSFVASQDRELLKENQLKLIEEKLSEVLAQSKAFNIHVDEIIQMLKLLSEDGP
ncbi:GntR family transcriptional regulator [Ammoniphilus oxalaticus]|uniref:GntR family transcriptional regulator n=1 Tax=Ammoniphilus oxalaticus TaxID=66863 RepID=A0A419SMV1_9BACL|nr:GntR family transcriptional regulator [Ammoniphilus oxalaticus]RKD25618.1 GntR family transcriptional regulator [Ammoniphilus oxalaticus]